MGEMGRNRIMRLRVSMAGLLGVVLFSGLILAALRSGSDGWFRAVYTATAASLLFGAVAARHLGAFWFGFAAVGVPYFAIGFGPWIVGLPGSEGRGLNRNLATTSLIVEPVAEAIAARDSPPPGPINGYYLMREGRKANLAGIVHSALTVALAIGGGAISRIMAAKQRRRDRRRTKDEPFSDLD